VQENVPHEHKFMILFRNFVTDLGNTFGSPKFTINVIGFEDLEQLFLAET
jgi:hypothetical protein